MDFLKTLADPLNMAGGGLLWKPMKKVTGLTDAQMAGLGLLAVGGAAAAPSVMAASSGGAAAGAPAASAPSAGGLMAYMQPAATGMSIANQAHQMSQGQPVQPGQLPQRQAPDMSGILNAQAQQQAAIEADRQRRLQQQQMAMQGLLGGRNGIA